MYTCCQASFKMDAQTRICDSCFAKITKETKTLPGPDGGKFERTKGRNGKVANYKLTLKTTKATAIKIKKKHPTAVTAMTLTSACEYKRVHVLVHVL